jgi:formylmethanofuran dehydrogenase subunit E
VNNFFNFNVLIRFPAEQLPQRPTLAFCARHDAAERKEKDFFSKPDPYIDAWMLLTGRVRKVFDVIKFVKVHPDVDHFIFSTRRCLKCPIMRDECPIIQAKQRVNEQEEKEAERLRKNESLATKGEEEEEEEQDSSPEDVFQIISTQTDWVMNNDKYMSKVYEHIRWR